MEQVSLPQADDIAYRDYLVDVCVAGAAGSTSDNEFGPPPPTAAQRRADMLASLRTTFKQAFDSDDQTVEPVNQIACTVLERLLVEDLGQATGSLPASGGAAWRDRLDELLALSHSTADSLERTLCIDLVASDIVVTTPVHQNIATLQRHLRDGAFPDENPFFLYKGEWRARFHSRFNPENHYHPKTGLFASPDDRTACLSLIAIAKACPGYSAAPWAVSAVDGLTTFLSLDRHLTDGHAHLFAEELDLAADDYAEAVRDVDTLRGHLTFSLWEISPDGADVFETTFIPDTGSAQAFRAGFDIQPSHLGWKLFAERPPTAYSPSWPGDWVTGQAQGWWKPVTGPATLPEWAPFTAALYAQFARRYDSRAGEAVTSPSELADLEAGNTVVVHVDPSHTTMAQLEADLRAVHDDLVSVLPHVIGLLLPLCLADLAAARSDFPSAAAAYAGIVAERLRRALLTVPTPCAGSVHEPHGDLPWTWGRAGLAVGTTYPYLNTACEVPFFTLRLAGLYLTWADRLYRADREAEVYRARELYKAVLRLYDIDPQPGVGMVPVPWLRRMIGAVWRARVGVQVAEPRVRHPKAGPALSPATKALWAPVIKAGVSPVDLAAAHPEADAPVLPAAQIGFILPVLLAANPQMVAQQQRARLALTQIDNGLNAYGYAEDAVPLLRYRPLVTAAQSAAALAKQALDDRLAFRRLAESEELNLLQAQLPIATARIRTQVESERVVEAEDQIDIAQYQVDQVNAAIDAKKAEIADHDSLCGQVKDVFSGIASFLSIVPGKAADYAKSDYASAFGFSSSSVAVAGLGVVGGIAAFGVAAGVTMSGVADAGNRRVAELQQLEGGQLTAAKANVDVRQRELTIAQLQGAIACLELAAAEESLRFSVLKELDLDLWTRLAVSMDAVLERYLELGAMFAWLAERALAYEQSRDIRIVRFDYSTIGPDGFLGPTALQADVEALEGERIAGERASVPLTWTVSLARDHTLEFGQLKATGRCLVHTSTDPLDRAHPGGYGHRIRTVEVTTVQPVTGPAPRGLLHNVGISVMRGRTAAEDHLVVRPVQTLPITPSSWVSEMDLYGLPGEPLLPFEGSAPDTTWLVELTPPADPDGLSALADVVLTMHLTAQFGAERRREHDRRRGEPVYRSMLVSAARMFPAALAAFTATGSTADLTMPIVERMFPVGEGPRSVTNVAVLFVGDCLPDVQATLASAAHAQGVGFTSDAGLAHSRLLAPGAPAPAHGAPLDQLVTGAPEQTWSLALPPSGNPALNRSAIRDVVLGLEYTTVLPG